jgi:hypothetical protein
VVSLSNHGRKSWLKIDTNQVKKTMIAFQEAYLNEKALETKLIHRVVDDFCARRTSGFAARFQKASKSHLRGDLQ